MVEIHGWSVNGICLSCRWCSSWCCVVPWNGLYELQGSVVDFWQVYEGQQVGGAGSDGSAELWFDLEL